MNEDLDLLIICGDQLRHQYFAIKLSQEFPSSLILIEKKRTRADDSTIIKEHFEEFERTEKDFFGGYIAHNKELFLSKIVAEIEQGSINEENNINLIKGLNPKIIAVHGTSIIGPELVSLFSGRMINLHAGLSPYYRGVGTNIWPFYNGELEYVGMTVHYIDEGVDTGKIILQGIPDFEERDNTHTIGCKNVILGVELMRRVIQRQLKDGKSLPSFEQSEKGKYYRTRDFTEEVVKKISENLERGIINNHIKNPKKVKIVEWENE